MEKEEREYEYYRQLYIEALNNIKFPWEAAYYYYTVHIDRIDIMGFDEFKEAILEESSISTDSHNRISKPIYEALERYYLPQYLLSTENKLIMAC